MDAIEELAELPQWVCWRSDPPLVDGGKRRKVPVSPLSGRNASTTDSSTWGTIDDAIAWRDAHPEIAGVGFVFTEGDPYTGIDLDGCIDGETGHLAAWAQAIVAQLDSYTEYSPSGRGLHVIVRARAPLGGNRRGGIEIYDQARYFTVTAQPLPGVPASISRAQPALDALHREVFGTCDIEVHPPARGYAATVEPDDDALLQRMFAAPNGAEIRRLWEGDARRYADAEHPAGNPSSADMALCAHLRFWTGGDQARADRLFRQSGLFRPKWDERRGDMSYGQRTLSRVRSSGSRRVLSFGGLDV
jgi:primase-polymerase (primpol)-like protein